MPLQLEAADRVNPLHYRSSCLKDWAAAPVPIVPAVKALRSVQFVGIVPGVYDSSLTLPRFENSRNIETSEMGESLTAFRRRLCRSSKRIDETRVNGETRVKPESGFYR